MTKTYSKDEDKLIISEEKEHTISIAQIEEQLAYWTKLRDEYSKL